MNTYDAIVIGSGPNGLVAANKLSDAGWSVLVLEAASHFGGAVYSSELMEPGFINDHFSAFYPLGAGSPVMKAMELERFGLQWKHSDLAIAHPALDGSCPVISRNIDETATSLGADGDAWKDLYRLWETKGDDLLQALFTPFPPITAGRQLAKGVAWKELIRFARFAVLPVRRLCDEHFETPQAARLLAGLALHSDLLPEAALSGFYGWLLAALAQDVGFPSPQGGSGQLTAALVARATANGCVLTSSAAVAEIFCNNNRVAGVVLEDGERFVAKHAVLADVDAPQLYSKLLPEWLVPSDIKRDLRTFQWDNATIKIDWNLNGSIPWTAPDAHRAGTVHIAESIDELSVTASELARNLMPTDPFLLVGQQSAMDPMRAPVGCETAWAYTHVPMSSATNSDHINRYADVMQARIEALAPGFEALIRGRSVFGPRDLQNTNRNLVGGALGGGTSQLHQQLVFRPTAGLGRPETHIDGLFLASSAAHPGGGVHGACGANAASAALAGPIRRKLVSATRRVGRIQSRNKLPIVP